MTSVKEMEKELLGLQPKVLEARRRQFISSQTRDELIDRYVTLHRRWVNAERKAAQRELPGL